MHGKAVPAAVSVRDVSKEFSGLKVLRGCSLSVAEGSVTGLIGPNGAGKSTLFNILAGADQPDSGELRFFGSRLEAATPQLLFELGVMRTFQIPHEFSRLTVLENLMMVPPGQSGERLHINWFQHKTVIEQERRLRKRARTILTMLHMDSLRHNLANALSGGQKKLLELGRTMMVDSPRILLLDEVAAGVNRSLLNVLVENIRRLNREKNTTVFVIEHDMAMIEALCETVIVMAEGTVIDEGPFARVRSNPLVLDAYLGSSSTADSSTADV